MMSTMLERKDYIANLLLARGVNQTTIIAILCNGYQESAGTFSPTVGAFNGDGGFGIWQFTNRPNQREIINYAQTHSEKEAIQYQVNLLLDHPEFYLDVVGFGNWDAFIHNTPNADWQRLVYVFMRNWERPNALYYHLDQRLAAYNVIMPINWDGNLPSGGSDPNDPNGNKKKYPSLRECLSMIDKANTKNNQPGGNTGGGGGGTVGGFNNQPCLDYYNRYKGRLYYSMPGRAGVYSGVSADCSSFVSYMLMLGFGLSSTQLYTTDSLHGYLTNTLGYKLVESGGARTSTVPWKAGDVYIQGRAGASGGAAGHTGICLSPDGAIYDCSYSANGLGSQPSGQAFIDYHGYGINPLYWYHYSK